jgi:hypothetical protein
MQPRSFRTPSPWALTGSFYTNYTDTACENACIA